MQTAHIVSASSAVMFNSKLLASSIKNNLLLLMLFFLFIKRGITIKLTQKKNIGARGQDFTH